MYDDKNDETDSVLSYRTSPLIYKSLLSIPGAILSGLSIYFVFLSLVLPFRITAPASIIMSILVFGLTMSFSYNSDNNSDNNSNNNDTRLSKVHANNKSNNEENNTLLPNTIFVGIYIIFLAIIVLFSKQNLDLFVHWESLTAINLIPLSAAISVSFFLPGYALISIIDKKAKLRQPLKLLLAYIFSTLISGMAGYLSASLGFSDLQMKILLIIVHTIIIVLFFKMMLNKENFRKILHLRFSRNRILRLLTSTTNVMTKIESLIFSSLFALIVLSTYYLYGGVIIGDQMEHHGTALVFMSGAYKDLASAGIGDFYEPPFLAGVLSSFFTLSSVPSVNAYVSINFLNFMPVIAFYYFFTKWIPSSVGNKAVALLATTLFMLSSGFGWVYLLNLAATTNPITSQTSALNDLFIASIKTFDIWVPNTFIDVGHPDITSGLIILALPAGFVLLGLIREDINDKIKYSAILVAVSTLGVFSHDEFNLFIVVASILLVIFRPPAKNYFFAAFLVSLSFQVLADTTLPGHYYTIRYLQPAENLGVPLIALYFVWVALTWAIDANKIVPRLGSHFKNITGNKIPITTIKKIAKSPRTRFILGVVIISIVCILYVLSFIVWGFKIPSLNIQSNLTNGLRIVPWYFYPLRFGITGLLGLCLILSYIFKRFEKEVLVFGIIAIFAFLAGPYYNEHRFDKYIMVSFSAFASLFLYRILAVNKRSKKALINSIIIGLVITSASFSTLLYAGYVALGLQNSDPKFEGLLGNRHFPSGSDIRMLNFLHHILNQRTDTIAIPANDTEPYWAVGLNAKLYLVGAEVTRTFNLNPLILNASTLEGFYDLLYTNQVTYIIMPKNILGTEKLPVPQFVSFALQDFVKVYQDDKYTVLSVPKLTSPLSKGDVALILQREPSLLSDRRDLPYNKESFGDVINSKSVKIVANGKIALLNGNVMLFSNTTINTNKPVWKYFEATFRIINETNNKDNHAGVVWNIGHKNWYAFLRDDRLSVWNSVDKEFLSSRTTTREDGIWYTLKVIVTENTINIYLNNVLQLQIPKDPYEKSINSIDHVGIRTYNTAAEFEAIRFGMISDDSSKGLYTHHYYPLSILALSNMRYDTFIENDFSVLSKRTIVLPSDPLDVNQTKMYLKYVNSGGIITVFNSDNNFTGGFSKLLAIQPSNSIKYDSIVNEHEKDILNISGVAKAIKLEKPCDVTIDSFYMKDNKKVAPFAVYRNYGNGRIIFVNIAGYFNAVLNSPSRFFLTLSRIPDLINLRTIGNSFFAGKPSIAVTSLDWYTGDLKVSGLATINSSSFSLVNGSSYSYYHPPSFQFYAKDFLVLNKRANHQYVKDVHFKNVLIKDIRLSGKYEVIINSSGQLYLPSLSSQYDYISMSIPSGFNVTLKVFPGASAEFIIYKHTQPIRVTNGQIEFHNIWPLSLSVKHILMVLKRPQINVNGNSSFENLYYYPDQEVAVASPLVMNGSLELKLDHVDFYLAQPNTVKYITYLKWINGLPRPKLNHLLG